ncbi:MAG: hypothetical protein COA85_06150 [Robiginitomaculum sp.]|nr:MAG: hypothetical protein COA85_06150 [Robiginitomaculum sp.]
MNLVKGLLVGMALLLLAGGLVWHFWGKGQLAYIEVATAYTAKQVCSCRFIAERELNTCLQDFTIDISRLDVVQVGNKIRSTGPMGISSSMAQYRPGLGCSLLK